MFDLEQAITEWRREMRAAGLKAPAVLDELESHLRDATAEQMRSGSTAAEAFARAIERLGPAKVLHAEFARARIPDGATIRKWAAAGYSIELFVYTALQARQLLKSAPSSSELLIGIAGLVVTLLVAYGGWRLAPRLMRCIPDQTVRCLMMMGGTLSPLGWMAIFAWQILPHFDFTPGQFAAVFLWAMLPMLAAPMLVLGLYQPAGERAR